MIGGDIIILEWYATWVNLAFPVCIFLLDYSLKELIRGLDEDLIKDLKNRNIKKDHLRILNKFSEDIGAIFLLKKGVIIKNNTDLNFWTSDNPIVRYNPNGDLGFNCDLIHVFFPLSPKLCLCLLDPFNYSNYSVEKKFDENNVEENIKAISIFN